MLKLGQNFHICLQSGSRGLTPPPPLAVSLTVKYPFFTTSLWEAFKYCFSDFVCKRGAPPLPGGSPPNPSKVAKILSEKGGGEKGTSEVRNHKMIIITSYWPNLQCPKENVFFLLTSSLSHNSQRGLSLTSATCHLKNI